MLESYSLKITRFFLLYFAVTSQHAIAHDCDDAFGFFEDGKPSTNIDRTKTASELTRDELELHLGIDTYNGFRLTRGIRPSPTLKVIPEEGYSVEPYFKDESDSEPAGQLLRASVSAENLFEVFGDLIGMLHPDISFYADLWSKETSFNISLQEGLTTEVFLAIAQRHADFLIHDGFLSIEIADFETSIVFDDHKLLYIYSENLNPFMDILEKYAIKEKPHLVTMPDCADHVHRPVNDSFFQFSWLFNDLKNSANP